MANNNRTYPVELTADAIAEIRKIIGEGVIEDSKLITANGKYDHLEVGAYASIDVKVQPTVDFAGTLDITENGIVTDIIKKTKLDDYNVEYSGPMNISVNVPLSNFIVPEDLKLETELTETTLTAKAYLDKDEYKKSYVQVATVELADNIDLYIHNHSEEIFQLPEFQTLTVKAIESFTSAPTAKAINVQFQPNPDNDKDIFVEACLTNGKSGSEHFDIKLTVEDFIDQLDKCGYRCYKKN